MVSDEQICVVGSKNGNNTNVVGFDGVCPLCGSSDGMIIRGNDGRYRNMCRVMGCSAWYIPSPVVGFEKENDCRDPFESEYLKTETITIGDYIGKKGVW